MANRFPELQEALATLQALLELADPFTKTGKQAGRGDPRQAVATVLAALRAVDWPPDACQHARGAKGMAPWLHRLAQSDAARAAVAAVEVALRGLGQARPRLELDIGAADLRPESDNRAGWHGELRGKVWRIANREIERRALDVSDQLVADPFRTHAEPHPDLFVPTWHGPSASAAEAPIFALVPDDDSPVLVAWLHDARVGLVKGRTVRALWLELVETGGWSDALVFPPDAAWLISYFHSDFITVARRTGPWPHRIGLPPLP